MRRPAPRSDAGGPRPLLPPRRVLVTLVSLAAAAALIRAGALEAVVGSIVDHAVRNIITLILAFSGLVSLAVWFLRESGHAPALRRAVGWGVLAAVVLACTAFRIERVSGDLVPEIVPRWRPARDRLLPRADGGRPQAAGGPWTAMATDFPRFLGPRGDCSLDGPAILPASDGGGFARERWRRPIGAGWGGFAVCGDHAVTLEQRGEEEIVSCLAVGDGAVEWTVPVAARHETVLGGAGPRSTPTIRDGVVYSTGATGWLHAIDGATGAVRWRRNVVDDLGIDAAAHAAAVSWGRAGSPLVTDALVIVPGGGPLEGPAGGFVSLAAYDRATGARVWTAGTEQITYVTPSLVACRGRDVVLTVNEAHAAAYDPADGRALWEFPWPGHSNSDATCSQPHVIDGERIFISKGYGIGAALFAPGDGDADAAVFRPVWTAPALLKTKYTNVAIHDGHAYGLSDGILECVRLADGKRAWKGGRYGQGQVLRVGAFLLVQAERGDVVLVDCAPDAHRVRGRIAALRGQTWNNPCVSGDRLLVRNAEEAACHALQVGPAVASSFLSWGCEGGGSGRGSRALRANSYRP